MYNLHGYYREFIRGGIERDYPDSYAVSASGDCMAPLWVDGDILLASPSATLAPGGFVAVLVRAKNGQLEFLAKRLLRPIPFFNASGTSYTGPLVALEMLHPHKRMGLEIGDVEFVHAVVGMSTGGQEPMRPIRCDCP